MKITDVLLTEMTLQQLPTLVDVLSRTVKKYGLYFKPLTHSVMRMIADPNRKDIDALDIYNTINKFLQTNHGTLEQFKKNRKEYVAWIKNPETNLNIVVSINFHERGEYHDFKIVTIMVKDGFKSDDFDVEKVIVH